MPPPRHPIPNISHWKGLLASFYGGITEEIFLRLFFMTLVVWIIWKIVFKSHMKSPAYTFWIAILAAAVIFAIGHLPGVSGIWPLTTVVAVRVITLNGLAGIVFGYLYWKWGLEYAMLSHFCADIVLHGIAGI